MVDSHTLLQKVVKYLIEGLAVAVVAYVIPKKSLALEEIAVLAVTAAMTFSVLDNMMPHMAESARNGAGLGVGLNLVGFPQ
tara:strand:- start:18 stop:260 length:243 start_codon:yes stop_codon:yes gene_type:complete